MDRLSNAERDALGEELADAAERGELTPTGDALHGDAARDHGRAMLMAATGAHTPEAAARLAMGRPRVGEDRPETRHWRLRVPADLDDAVRRAAARDGVTVSDVVRRAAAAHVAGGAA